MSSKKILYVCQEISPYLAASENAQFCRALLQGVQECGNEIRSFTPRYGVINERRNQLHEVIRLSGMNLIINNNDNQLIIKVASIPLARVQVYFIDNEDFFSRKAVLADAQGDEFEDNDERAIFFARGVLETVKKLRWSPDVVHCHGWFSTIVPIYLKHTFADDPIFQDVKVVVSLYDDEFTKSLNPEFKDKIASEGLSDDNIDFLTDPSYENLYKFVMTYADGVVIASENVNQSVVDYARAAGKKILEYKKLNFNDEGVVEDAAEAKELYENYDKFYESL
ncbi:MAG: glycogen/starch synthase [Rikenellaceae bacterium]